MDMRLEVIVVPVSDVDRAKAFYSEVLGFNVDVDRQMSENFRVVQLTPPGSACSVAIGPQAGEPGSVKGLQLLVADIAAARAELTGRGLEASQIQHIEDGAWVDGPGGDWNSFFFFSDPDGNGWAVQQSPGR
jgi:catechol 2,3-dioxygenase-like lactoylglutathione lyase family enzyme